MTLSAVVWASTVSPSPSPSPSDPQSVSAGLWGFAVVFVLAIAVWLLMRNMTGHLRRMRFREQEQLRREAAEGSPQRRPDRPDDEPPPARPGA